MNTFTKIDINTSGIVTLWLNRPDVKNALNAPFIQELTQQLNVLADDSSVRLLVVRGQGSHFSAGADLEWMQASAKQPYDANVNDASQLANLLSTLDQFPTPTLAYVHGGAFGGATAAIL